MAFVVAAKVVLFDSVLLETIKVELVVDVLVEDTLVGVEYETFASVVETVVVDVVVTGDNV